MKVAWWAVAVATVTAALASVDARVPAAPWDSDVAYAAGPTPGLMITPGLSVHASSLRTYPTFDDAGNPLASQSWRVVKGTGNCCENYLATTSAGRLLDFGGTYLRFSDDRGVSWKVVRPPGLLLSGEGAVTVAPGGDVVGLGWDPYSGDHLQAFKYEAEENKWYWIEAPVHEPVYDRPWLNVVPGPITFAGTTYPYVALAEGGVGALVWGLSLDGLNYVAPTTPIVRPSGCINPRAWLPVTANAEADWVQPVRETFMAPLSGGGVLHGETGSRSMMKGTLDWRAHCGPGTANLPAGSLRQDSLGRVHASSYESSNARFVHRVSLDGGATFPVTVYVSTAGIDVEDWDVKVNGALDLVAYGVHGHVTGDTVDRDAVFKIAGVGTATPVVTKYHVGLGDLDFGAGAAYTGPRFDFQTVAIFADGKVAISIGDSENESPSVAIEQ